MVAELADVQLQLENEKSFGIGGLAGEPAGVSGAC